MIRNAVHQKFNRSGEMVDMFSDWCDKHALWGVAVLSIIYLLVNCRIASRGMLWNDEFFTRYILLAGFSPCTDLNY